MTSTLPAATLLIMGGGFLDSYAWVAHGHVFTNAISGNIILFGVFAAEGQWQQAIPHLPPTLAFFVGAAAAQGLRWCCPPRSSLNAQLVSLGIEMAVLAAISVLPARVPKVRRRDHVQQRWHHARGEQRPLRRRDRPCQPGTAMPCR